MKHKKRGRKIYTYQARNRRVFSDYHPIRSAVGSVVFLIVAVVIGFVGYNVIGPIVTRIHQEEISPTATAEPYFTEAPLQTAPSSETTTVLSAVTTAEQTAETTVTVTTEPLPSRFAADLDVAYLVSADSLKSLDAVEAAAKSCRENGYTSMILPLKLDTGMLQYASSVDKAVVCGASNDSMLTLREIVNAAKRYDVKCIAEIYTLEDHVFPNYFMEGSYVFKDGTTRWLDNNPDEGGKPWLNPFDAASGDYLAGIAAEIQKSGFTQIICKGTVFPNFFHSDAELLGGRIEDKIQRNDALAAVLNRISDVAPTAGLYADLGLLAVDGEESFLPDQLRMSNFYINIVPADFTEAFTVNAQRFEPGALAFREKIEMLAEAARTASGAHVVIPCLDTSGMTENQIDEAVDVLNENGFKTICMHRSPAAETDEPGETDEEPEE